MLNVVFTPDGRGLVTGSGDIVVKYWFARGNINAITEYVLFFFFVLPLLNNVPV
jgi:WD40 repeat protein